ncbi:putative peptidoglycan binding protein [Pseudochrobactrum asaccharolyticum]|uniref:Putative peptidoglycan binding protein n=2 Tax=Pseudochrobactrum asaccharolyticum TaxID=354351 RepID=A0A366E0G5_9HYPH|nr:putative peptidoglycan binding protein [Pseudochrobactrum asaccharolyticum]
MFDSKTYLMISEIAKLRGISAPALAAVVEVESNGIAFAKVDGRDVPLIRIEGHYFDRLVPAKKQKQARDAGLASPKVGAVKNPKNQLDRYRMLQRMCDIDQAAAIMSCSWGVGQVMGVLWKKLGFSSTDDFRIFVMSSLKNQIEVMVRFIEFSGLIDELKRLDWAGFARVYNGPGYKANAYDTKMANAYARYGGKASSSPASGMLRSGSSGAGVRELQTLLQRAGYSVAVDGDFGPATKKAVFEFQQERNLEVDGVVGPKTQEALRLIVLSPSEQPGRQDVSSVPAVKNAVKGGGAIAIVLSIRDQIGETASYLSGMGAKFADNLSSGLLAVSGFIGICLAIYAAYGWWKSRQTVEQG